MAHNQLRMHVILIRMAFWPNIKKKKRMITCASQIIMIRGKLFNPVLDIFAGQYLHVESVTRQGKDAGEHLDPLLTIFSVVSN